MLIGNITITIITSGLMGKIPIYRLGSLGDTIVTLPALRLDEFAFLCAERLKPSELLQQ